MLWRFHGHRLRIERDIQDQRRREEKSWPIQPAAAGDNAGTPLACILNQRIHRLGASSGPFPLCGNHFCSAESIDANTAGCQLRSIDGSAVADLRFPHSGFFSVMQKHRHEGQMESSATTTVTDRSAESRLIERLQRLPELANADEHLVHRGRFVSLDFQVVVGARPCFISVRQGRIEHVELTPQRMRSCAFVLKASTSAWEEFWQPVPKPWWHDLFAMNKKGNVAIDGDLHPFMANLQYFKDVMALPRRLQGAA